MDTLLISINSKYSHTGLAVRYLEAAIRRAGGSCQVLECTINQLPHQLLSEIYRRCARPTRLLFSTYIWNVATIARLGPDLKAILPHCPIFCGGPEAGYDPDFLSKYPWCDGVLTGEGDIPVPLLAAGAPLPEGPGLHWRDGARVVQNGPAPVPDMDQLPFVYTADTLPRDRTLYYETSRGCPFHCHYCRSGAGGQVRFRSLEKVFAELDFFLAQRVRQVKFVDRTFNCDRARARTIWRYLMEHDNGVTNFHFELGADLLGPEDAALLEGARRGLFQFEIGVQSTHPATVAAVQRVHDFRAIAKAVGALLAPGNIHIHLDLIAGLPHEDLTAFSRSFDDVYRLHPHQLQLGFLKLLHGSLLRQEAEGYGIVCSEAPPYQVLRTRWLSFADLLLLEQVEDCVDTFYNCGRYRTAIGYLEQLLESPFALYCQLAQYMQLERQKEQVSGMPAALSKEDKWRLLLAFGTGLPGADAARLRQCIQFDRLRQERPKKHLSFLDGGDLTPRYRQQIRDFYGDEAQVAHYLPGHVGMHPAAIAKSVYIHVFPYPVWPDSRETAGGPVAVLFDYSRTDPDKNAIFYQIDLGGSV